MAKVCKDCKEEKELSYFTKTTVKGKEYYRAVCAKCLREKKTPEQKRKALEATKEYKERNRDKVNTQRRKRYAKNPKKFLEESSNWRKRNKEKIQNLSRRYYKENKDKIQDYRKRYEKKAKHIIAAGKARYRAAKRNAVPGWLTEDHHKEIASIYKRREEVSTETGITHHVDHIVPLQGKNVCGLHVPWNLQVIPASENLKKHRHLGESYVWK